MRGEPRSWLLLAALCAGCWGNEVTMFPPGLEPLEENPLASTGTADDPFPEGWILQTIDGGRYDTVYARGYYNAPLTDVWAAFQDPVVGTDQRGADEWSVEQLEDPAYDVAFVVDAIAYEIVTVEWWTTWRQGLAEGTPEAPEVVAIRWQKTDGSTLLRLIEGSLVLRSVDDGASTELDLVYHVDATGAGIDQYTLYVEDTLGDARAILHGEPVPTYH